jgi:N-acetylneuraminic acid mutarotase
MKRIVYFLAIINFISISGFSQTQNSWTKKMNFGGLKRERAVSFAIGSYGYVGTGEDTVNMTHNDLWQYDPALDVWTQMANLPGPCRRNAVGFSIGSKGYIGTGIDSSESFAGIKLYDFWEYDPSGNSWTAKANYPGGGGFGVYYAGAFSTDTKGYITCGKVGSNWYAFDLWEYDPAFDTWTQKANFPGGVRYALSALTIDGKGYVGLGIDNDLYRRDWWEYDPSTDIWTVKTQLPGTERGAASTFTIVSKGFVVFGADGGYKDELWEYSPYTDSWNIKSNFSGGERRNGIAFAIGDKGYAGTGKGPSGLRQNFYEYTPALPVGVDEYQKLNIDVYPNPITENALLFIQNESDAASFVIADINGNLVKQELIQSQSVEILRGDIAAGMYHLIVLSGKGTPLATQKIIFQ